MSSSHTFYPERDPWPPEPEPDEAASDDPSAPVSLELPVGVAPGAGSPGVSLAAQPARASARRPHDPASRIHPARPAAAGPVAQPRHLRRWALAPLLSGALAGVGVVFYASLYVLVGQEILAAAIMIGLLAGAGIRLGGAQDRWSIAFVAGAIGSAAWCVAAVLGTALLDTVGAQLTLQEALLTDAQSPLAAIERQLQEPLLVVIAVGLVICGAIVSTATFTRGRRREPGVW
ncbi:hypothetical protein [Demequina sp.]|uniref:hypothetical protein n=1 Tax=Demequina sp. TaxID=2050685 RepID=UPI003A882A3C